MSEFVYLARQPVIDRAGQLYGFELLFRRGDTGASDVKDGMQATSTVLGHVLTEMGMAQVLGKLRGFLNVNADFLHSELVDLLQPERMILEVLECTQIDDALLDRCAELRKRGFELALDDYSGNCAHIEQLLPLLTFVKIDLPQVPEGQLAEICAPLRKHQRVKLIAEKVETQEQMQMCRDAGIDYFQGYYFARPEVLSAKRTGQNRASMLRLLALIYGDAELNEIEDEFKRHPQQGYNLLRLVNSAASGLSTKIASIKHALVLLGRRQLQVWLQLLLYTGDGADPNLRSPLLQTAAMRGCLMEAIAKHEDPQGQQYHDYAFMTGMLSLVDVLLGMSRGEIVEQLNLVDDVRNGLIKGEGRLGRMLDLVERLETSDRSDIEPLLAAVKLNMEDLLVLEMGAFRWANNLLDPA
jgi:c-di-GMP-related signal transduction protein